MPKPHIPLDELRVQVESCRRCPLCDGRTQTVFGVGNPHARVMFIGEAPGKNEDLQGEPFVGAAGHYLNELLGCAGLRREDVFIANVLKCRPPGNRDPRPEEILHAVSSRANAHHRPGSPGHAREVLHAVRSEDAGGHHASARSRPAGGQVPCLPHLPPRRRALRRRKARSSGKRFRNPRRAAASTGRAKGSSGKSGRAAKRAVTAAGEKTGNFPTACRTCACWGLGYHPVLTC